MSVKTLEAAINQRAGELLPAALMRAARQHHDRVWRTCPCSYCETKREATLRIGNIDLPREAFSRAMASIRKATKDIGEIDFRDARERLREQLRQKYRPRLDDHAGLHPKVIAYAEKKVTVEPEMTLNSA